MTCTCTTEHTGELTPTGCQEHPGQWLTEQEQEKLLKDAEPRNFALRHRHGEAWHMSEEGATGALFKPWQEWAIGGVIMVAAFAWLVWG
jgi:hypothetical protein